MAHAAAAEGQGPGIRPGMRPIPTTLPSCMSSLRSSLCNRGSAAHPLVVGVSVGRRSSVESPQRAAWYMVNVQEAVVLAVLSYLSAMCPSETLRHSLEGSSCPRGFLCSFQGVSLHAGLGLSCHLPCQWPLASRSPSSPARPALPAPTSCPQLRCGCECFLHPTQFIEHQQSRPRSCQN